MLVKYILFLILFLMVISLFTHFSILFKEVENFDSHKNCVYQGYPRSFCTEILDETSGPCVCPSGQKSYIRHSRCYCQTYAT